MGLFSVRANLHSGMEQMRVIAQLLEGRDARQVRVCLRGALKAGSEHPVAEELPVELPLQGGQLAEQRPVQAGGQVAVDDLLRAPQDEHAGEPGQLRRSLLAQVSLLLVQRRPVRREINNRGSFAKSDREERQDCGEDVAPGCRRAVWSAGWAPHTLSCRPWTTPESPG